MTERAALRPEIQALRGIAVSAVVACHLWPSVLRGGFVGVDVFFAVSGLLITSHLLREVDRTGRVSLAAFWARRARRILPAALTVLLFCAVATLAVVPETSWPQFLAEVRASTLYVQNWHLASSAVDYFASTDGPSPVQHYWSLSLEEQFYLVWPLVVGAIASRRGLTGAMLAIAAASLAYSIHRTAADPAAAYFVTPTRAWEFAAGGLLATLGPPAAHRLGLRSAASWLGLAAIAGAVVAYSAATPFPGIAAALPVGGALAVMWAGAPDHRLAPTRLFALAPLRFLGDTSYSLYLWHWPLLVLAPFALGQPAGPWTRLAVLALSLLAAWLTKLAIEDPVRIRPFLTLRRARWTFATVGAGTGIVLAVAAAGTLRLQDELRSAERASNRLLAHEPACFAAAERDGAHPCRNPRLRLAAVPSPIEAHAQRNVTCPPIELDGRVFVCGFGFPPKLASTTVALVGDSHAGHWRAALEEVARAEHWAGVSITHQGCPLSQATKSLDEPARTQCSEWNDQTLRWFRRHPEVSTVFVSAISGGKGVIAPGRDQLAAQRAGYVAAWDALPASVEHIVVLRDTPKALGSTDACVEEALASRRPAGETCSLDRATVLQEDSEATAAARLRSSRVTVVDLTRFFCDAARCYPVIGGALVYKDENHMTETYSRSLGPYLLRTLVHERLARPAASRPPSGR